MKMSRKQNIVAAVLFCPLAFDAEHHEDLRWKKNNRQDQ